MKAHLRSKVSMYMMEAGNVYKNNASINRRRDEEKSSMVVGRDVVPDVGDANG